MTDWLLDTLVWTGVLLALVMVLRRPVAQHFGPQAAYALWALPFLRLLMPGLTLPAWMNPAPEPVAAPVAEVVTVWVPKAAEPVAPAVAAPAASMLPDLLTLALAAWLVGAAVFLVFRFRAYFDMRRELLAEGREVGRVDGGWMGPIRLVESPATDTPLAFGVLDRVVVLPPRFLALAERSMRDLALAHELAHHRGGDLIANFAVQPLFALHWFNPLGWVGWRAMRRDQEAACDARVVRTADAGLRATYAQTIASFAAGPAVSRGVAMAAPMACPVLGDKSIIHRLRSLTMSDISARRRWAGRSLLLAGALALPLTASISYAEAMQDAPPPPRVPEAAGAPAAPEAPSVLEWNDIDGDNVTVEVTETEDGKHIERRIVRKSGEAGGDDGDQVFIIKTKDKDGKVRVEERRVKGFTFTDEDGNEISQEEFEKQFEQKWEWKAKEWEKMGEEIGAAMEKRIEMRLGDGVAPVAPVPPVAPVVKMKCDKAKGTSSKVATADGAVAISICAEGMAKETMALVAQSLGQARKTIEIDRNLTDEQRAEALRAIDAEIARMNKEG